MPQGNDFWNPYRFVPQRPEEIQRKPPLGHHRLEGWSGTIECQLEALTSIVTGQRAFTRRKDANQTPFIPGTSLKGMLRSIAEVVGHGCTITDKQRSCQHSTELCITCRIFGFLSHGRGGVHAGQVSIGDALLVSSPISPRQWEKQKVVFSTPKTEHISFYADRKARKVYHHQPGKTKPTAAPVQVSGEGRVEEVEYAPAKSVFQFSLTFQNLTDEELGLLFYILELEPSLAHKVGGCKPLGAGSCCITITDWNILSAKERFLPPEQRLSKTQIEEFIYQQRRLFEQDVSETMQALRALMEWAPSNPKNIRYPDGHWFRHNSQVKLRSWKEFAAE